jgi:hypothetical protein
VSVVDLPPVRLVALSHPGERLAGMTSARRIAIVGAGPAGTALATGLLHAGQQVTLVSDRTPQEIRSGSVMSSQVTFESAPAGAHHHEVVLGGELLQVLDRGQPEDHLGAPALDLVDEQRQPHPLVEGPGRGGQLGGELRGRPVRALGGVGHPGDRR